MTVIDDTFDQLRSVVADAAESIHQTADAIVATGHAGCLARPAGAGHSLAAMLATFFVGGEAVMEEVPLQVGSWGQDDSRPSDLTILRGR